MYDVTIDEYGLTRFEKARIIGSRSLQIAMGAPILVKMTKKELEAIKYNPLKIAEKELEKGAIPITVKRIYPHELRSQTSSTT